MRLFARRSAAPRTAPAETTFATEPPGPELDRLIEQISRGSQDAFVTLFDHTSPAVLVRLASCLPDPKRAIVVLSAVYVEVWWLAGCHTEPAFDVAAWIDKIAERRISDEPRSRPRAAGAVDPRSLYAPLELAALLGRPVETFQAR